MALTRVRQVRVLIYEGPAEEVKRMVTSEGRYVYGRRTVGDTTISEYLAPPESVSPTFTTFKDEKKVEGCF